MTLMPPLLLLLALVSGEAGVGTGYVHTGDLNGDGVPDSIMSGPSGLFGNGGGPFIVSLSDGKGGFRRIELALHPQAVALDQAGGHPRLWTYWRSSCCAGTLSVTTLDGSSAPQHIPLDFGQDPGAPTLSRALYDSVFRESNRIAFERVDNYQPPPPLGGEWGK
ncbi:hypothetical protein [Arenimonas soli]|nr:hypothetical protein [Arenimonas soli]